MESGNNVPADYGVTVTVTDVDEPGMVRLSTTTATLGVCMTATVEDPDGPVTDAEWGWERLLPSGEWVDATPPLQAPENLVEFERAFLPTLEDVGRTLRARVSYRDALSSDGQGKSEASAETLLVEWGDALDLQVFPELGELEVGVSLSLVPCRDSGPVSPTGPLLFRREDVVVERCTLTDGPVTCVELSGNEFVQRGMGGVLSGSSGTRSAQARARVSSSLTLSAPVAAVDNSLDIGKTYWFTAYLVGPEGQPSPESNEVTVLGLRSEARAGAVGLSWDAPAGIEGITGWGYRYKQEDGTWDENSWQTTGTGATVTAAEVGSLTNGVSYEFQVRALRGTATGPESFVGVGDAWGRAGLGSQP